MVLKGLPDDYKAFIAVTTQAENVENFQKFKTSWKTLKKQRILEHGFFLFIFYLNFI